MKRKRPTRESDDARYRQVLEGQRKAFARLVHVTSLLFLAINQKENTKSEVPGVREGHQRPGD